MTSANLQRDELFRLLASHCDGGLSEADGHRLADALRDDPAVRRLYIEYMDLHGWLAWECSSAADLDLLMGAADAAGTEQPHKGMGGTVRRILRSLTATPQRLSITAASLVVMTALAMLAFMPAPLMRTRGADPPQPSDRLVAAVITATVDCHWEQSALPLGHGSSLYKGQQIELLEGTAQITFSSGAVVTLTGPAVYVIDSPLQSSLRLGELAAQVPPAARGFAVNTPAAMVVDWGTEFGVSVTLENDNQRGMEEVHVFTGGVEVSFPGANVPPQRLAANQAVRILSDDGTITLERLGSAARERFPQTTDLAGDTTLAEPLPAEEHPPFTKGLVLWLAADGAIRRDAEGRVWVWEDMLTGDNTRVQNATQRLAAHRPRWVAAAVGGKPAIRFDGNSYLSLATPASFGLQGEPYEMFVVAQSSSNEVQFLVGGGVEDFEIHLNGEAGARFIPAGYASGAGASNLSVSGQFSDGQPHIFAARVLAGEGHRGVLAVDGEESTDRTDLDARSTNNTSLRLGMRHNAMYGLRGEIAEVLIYRGQLTPVQRLQIGRYLSQKYSIRTRY